MKKILCIIAFAFLLMHIASAQPVLGGRIMISGLDVARTEGNLFVSMDMDLSPPLDLKTDRELIVTPVLYTGTDSLSLSPVVIAGRNRYFHHVRNGISQEEASLYREGSISVVEYRAMVPYAVWMGHACLRIDGLVCGCCGAPVDGESDLLSTLDMEPRVFIPSFVYLSPDGEAVKMRVEKGSAYIDFPVNRTEIYEDYRSNAAELRKIRSTIELVHNDPDTRITSVSIKGYASPEGPYDNNVRLAKGRTRTLKEYVRRQYDFPDSLMHTSYEPEDWEGLERFVRNSGLAGRDGIIEVMAGSLAPDAKEWKIKSSWPEDYAFLLKEVYPGLRHSDYAVEYEVRTYTDVDEIRRILRTRPQKLSLQEMYLAARQMEPGSEEYNETFEIAVRMFPDDPAANLNAANSAMSRGDLKSAGKYLTKAGDSPEAVYARGVHAALSGDYAAAEEFFAQAQKEGVAEAAGAVSALAELK